MSSLRDFSTSEPPGKRVEVEIDQTNPAEMKLKLREQSWAEGLGWFTQKSLTIDPAQAQNLIRDLQQALDEAKMRQSQAHHQPPVAPEQPTEKVIEFPRHRAARRVNPPVASGESKVVSFKSRQSAR